MLHDVVYLPTYRLSIKWDSPQAVHKVTNALASIVVQRHKWDKVHYSKYQQSVYISSTNYVYLIVDSKGFIL